MLSKENCGRNIRNQFKWRSKKDLVKPSQAVFTWPVLAMEIEKSEKSEKLL